MIALFISLSIIFSTDVRAFQTYIEIIKTAIIAVSIRFMPKDLEIVFIPACFITCLIILPIHQTLIYNIPSLIGGWTIGRHDSANVKGFMIFFIVNTLMILYEFTIYNALIGMNLFLVYFQVASGVLFRTFGSHVSDSVMHFVIIVFLLGDSLISSFIIYVFSRAIIKQVQKIINKNHGVKNSL